jgi:acyl-CoA synthetase (AMP-forming)/AMP-acid ligase II
MGLVGFCLSPMLGQVSVDFLSTTSFARRPALWLKLMSDNATTITYSPSFGYDLAARRINGEAVTLDLSRLRVAGIGGDMVRAAGIGFTLDAAAPRGQRVTWLRLADGSPVEAGKGYAVAGWASVAEPAEGRPVWEAVFDELARGPVAPSPNPLIRLA